VPTCARHVEQLADRHGRAAARVRALVVAGVGDDRAVAGRHQRVEQHLAVLGARVAVADVRVGEHQVVAVARRLARERASSSPSRQTTRCGTERIGTSVQIVRWPVRKFARVGRPCRRSASSARTSASASSPAAGAPRDDVVEHALELARCQASRGAVAVERVGGGGERLAQPRPAWACEARRRASAGGRRARRAARRGRSRRSRRRRAAARREQPVLLLGHRHADAARGRARPPGARRQRRRA
jgi:hypothetical protein